jgi:hypothetical protein
MRVRMGTSKVLVLVALSLAVVGCRRGQDQSAGVVDEGSEGGGEAASQGPPAGWPRVLVVGPGAGPGLFFGPEADAPAFGYVNPGTRIRIESGVRNGRVEALVAGPMATKGWIPAERVAAYVQRRGRLNGTPFYLGPNDFVTVLGPAEDGQMRVAARPWLGGGTFLEAQVGTFPADVIAADRVDPATAEAPTPGDCYRMPAQTVQIFDRPDGRAVATIPASDPPGTVVVLRARDPWYGVRAGYGPFVVGYMQGPLTACEGARPDPAPMVPPSSGEVPYWMARENGSLHRVASGTRIRFNGRSIARLRRDGWARELGRQEGDLVDVFVAVDEGVALRGLVPADSLTLVEQGESQPQRPAEPEEDLPDELQ